MNFLQLFETTGWNASYRLNAKQLRDALKNSWLALSAYAGADLIGFGRIISDGILHALIVDLIVHPAYRDRGIGGTLLDKLVEACLESGIRDIQLFCARDRLGFYLKRGFRPRPADAPGMEYAPPDAGDPA